MSSDKRTLTWENGRSEGIRKGQVGLALMAIMVLMVAITSKEASLHMMITLIFSTSGFSQTGDYFKNEA